MFHSDADRKLLAGWVITPYSCTLPRFACADQNFDVSMGGQIRFMKEVVPWLEQEDIIEKYAWFSSWDT